MKTVETKLSAGKIIDIKKLSDGTWVIKQEVSDEDKVTSKEASSNPKITILDSLLYRRVEAESLSLKNKFMKHEPKTEAEKRTKELIKEAIDKGVRNFYRPIIDPSFTSDGENICFEEGKNPAVGKSYNWWSDVAKKYGPQRNSRLGTRLEYGAFLGVLIKNLVAYGADVSWAWNAVCNDSRELGHYRNSKNAKRDFEPTGSRCVCGYYDLANTYKILAEDDETGGFWWAGGGCNDFSFYWPLAVLYANNFWFNDCNYSVGWLVLS